MSCTILIINIGLVYMEEKRVQYYNSLNGVGKGHKYMKGTLQYLYDLDEK